MKNCDLVFEYSDVNAKIIGEIQSVKNPCSGLIIADRIGEVIKENGILPNNCEIYIN